MISSSYLPGDLFTDEPIVHACTLGNRNEIKLDALLDTGATGHAFIDESMVRTICEQLQIEPQKLTKPNRCEDLMDDGSLIYPCHLSYHDDAGSS